MKIALPIDSRLEEIVQTVQQHPISIVQAPPGSGKTTRVAPALLHASTGASTGFAHRRIYLLQPRRLAARSVAQRIAAENSWDLGREVGYHVRFEKRYQRETNLIVATEGVLLRRLQDDATLGDTGIVLLDEFHERSLDADLLLGMLMQLQASVRDDLRIVIMSATLDSEQLSTHLGQAPIVRTEGRLYPVAVRYRPPAFRQPITETMSVCLVEIAKQHPGDILAFLPGQGEIHRVREALSQAGSLKDFDIYPLYGSLPLEEQTKIIEPGLRRRIVLATNVAETSLTIEGIRVVVDSGLARVMRFDPSVGLDRLCLEPIALDSATQRTGRAGRTAEGLCYRLWDEASHRSRAATLEPEVRRIDLASAVLQLYRWGHTDIMTFPWVTPPRLEAVEAAIRLLEKLGAIDQQTLTAWGMKLLRLPLHPRLGRMVLEGSRAGYLRPIALVAAMLSERDPFQSQRLAAGSLGKTAAAGSPPIATHTPRRWRSDTVQRWEAIESFLQRGDPATVFGTLQRGAVQTIVKAAQDIERSVPPEDIADRVSDNSVEQAIMQALLRGFPDRLAKRRSAGSPTGLMVGGRAVQLAPTSGVQQAELFLGIDVDGGGHGPNALVRQASAVELDWLVGPLRSQREELFFHPSQQQVVARRREYWDDLLLSETPMAVENRQAAAELLYRQALMAWERVFPADDEELVALVQRCRWLKRVAPEVELPDLSLEALQAVCRQLCEQCRSFAELRKAPWQDWISGLFSGDQLRVLERQAPRRLEVPSGSSLRLTYEPGKAPILAVKIQEVFSWKETPRLAFGRVPVLLHLLAPNSRPQQVTDDLASFWATGYPMVKKELKRRYPKHAWPDDPANATPSRK
jgi:ATP-dependent helicase HrpB